MLNLSGPESRAEYASGVNDHEISKGVSQIAAIRSHLIAHPMLLADRGYVSRELTDFNSVEFCVVSRDHLIESQDKTVPVFGYDAFLRALSGLMPTPNALEYLNSMRWLPKTGEDFRVEWNVAAVGQVKIISETFFSMDDAHLLKYK